jgi:SHS2 domain-containing protein
MADRAGYDYFEVEADVGVHAWGPTRAEAFARAALGVLALVIAPDGVEARETREVRAQGEGPEILLVSFINECLYVHEIEGFAVRRVDVDMLTERLVHGVLHGEPIDLSRHSAGTVVKAATLHGVSVSENAGIHDVRLIVDV